MITKRLAKEIYLKLEESEMIGNEKQVSFQTNYGEWVVKIWASLEYMLKKEEYMPYNYEIETIQFINDNGDIEQFDYSWLKYAIGKRLNENYL